MKRFIYYVYSVLVAMLVSCGQSGGGDTPPSDNGAGNPKNPDNALVEIACETSTSIPMVGCWRSEACVRSTTTNANGQPYYYQYIADFRLNNTMTHHLLSFIVSDCTGTPDSVNTQPFDTTYQIVETITTNEGLLADLVGLTWEVSNQSGTDFIAVNIQNDRLCLNVGGLTLTENGGGISSVYTSSSNVPRTIDVTNCLTRG